MRRTTNAVLICCTMLAAARVSVRAQRPGADHFRLVERARSLTQSGPVEQAIAAYDSATANAPLNSGLWLAYAGVLERGGRPLEAARALTRAVTLGATFGAATEYRVARNYSLAGTRDSALHWLERALQHRFEGRSGILSDTAFKALRADARFKRLSGVAPVRLPRVQAWRADLEFLVAEAQRLHAGLEREAHADTFLAAAARLRRHISSWSDDRIRLELRALLAMLGDGHTDLFYAFSRLPLDFYLFSDGLFVIRATGSAQDLVGAQVLSLGALTAVRAMREVARFVPRDNDMGLRMRGPVFLGQPIVLQTIGAARDTTGVDLTIRDRSGRVRTVHVTAIGRAAPQIMLRPPAGAGAPPPLYMSDTTRIAAVGLDATSGAMWLRQLPQAHALYLQYNAVANLPTQTTRQFADSMKALLRTQRTRHLIVDVRNNSGGNTFLYPPLLNAIIHFRESAPEHRVWVIIGRRTFSAAQNFATTIERYIPDVTFVGEPTGSRPNFVGESPTVVLPHSGLRLAISSRYHQNVDFTDRRVWIAPQVPTPLSSRDYFANRDPALQAILELISQPQ
jgi:tetratricopeptide (TPR) repeat protein